MKILTISLLATVFFNNSFATEKLNDIKDGNTKLNYSIGYRMGSDFKQNNLDIRPEALLKGMQDALSENESQMTRKEMRDIMFVLSKHIQKSKKKK